MKRAGLYVRCSTDRQETSIQVQKEEAARYAAGIGAVIAPEHVYSDEAISRAEYVRRPGLLALLNATSGSKKSRSGPPPFDILILRDVDRLGGDQNRNGVILGDLIDRGIEIHEYLARNVIKALDAQSAMILNLRNFASAIEKEKVSARTREKHVNLARKGLVTGGRVYGYRNVRTADGVRLEIDEEEATIVREIFRRNLRGEGLRSICHDLTARGVPSPRTGAGFWSPGTIQPMLYRERYIGRIVWGRRHKTVRHGTKVRVPAEPEVIEERPDLRIIDQETWDAIEKRMERRAKLAVGKGKAPRPVRIPTMLGGFLECGICKGRIGVERKVWGTPKPGEPRKSVLVYYCTRHRRSGPAACSNSARRPVSIVDDLMAKWVRTNIFSPSFVEHAVRDVRVRLAERRKTASRDVPAWTKQAAKLQAEIDKLGKALLDAKATPAAVVQMIADREAKLEDLKARIEQAKVAPEVIEMEVARMEQTVLANVASMRRSWPWTPEAGRAHMEDLLDGRLTVTPTSDGRFRIAGSICIADCDPIQIEEGRPVPKGRMVGLDRQLAAIDEEDKKKKGSTQDHVCSRGVPDGIRTRVSGVKSRGPGPLDDGDQREAAPNYRPGGAV